jgi:hypothetical protein
MAHLNAAGITGDIEKLSCQLLALFFITGRWYY